MLEITVPSRHVVKVRGARVHRSVALHPEEIARRSGVPCTTFERTLCDLTTRLSWLQLSRVLDDGLRRGVTSTDRLRACVARIDSGPNRRLTIVQSLLAARGAGYNPGGSDAELDVLDVVRRAGLPLPTQQHRIRVGGDTYYLDFSWPEFRVFMEYYGLPWHIGAAAVVRDSARITALSTAGWRPLIYTSESSEDQIAADVARVLTEVGCLEHRLGA